MKLNFTHCSKIILFGQAALWSAYLTSDKRSIKLALAPGGAGTREQVVVYYGGTKTRYVNLLPILLYYPPKVSNL